MTTWQAVTSFGIGGLIALAMVGWLIKYLVPALMERFDRALAAFQAEMAAERENHREQVAIIAEEIKRLREARRLT